MNESKQIKETGADYITSLTSLNSSVDLSHPVVLEQDGEPMAVLMSVENYERYQRLLAKQEQISAGEARRAADQALFGDLVGCALSSDDPIWAPKPEPHWRVPYRLFDGTLVTIVTVDAHTGAVSLTEEERAELLEQVESLVAEANAAT